MEKEEKANAIIFIGSLVCKHGLGGGGGGGGGLATCPRDSAAMSTYDSCRGASTFTKTFTTLSHFTTQSFPMRTKSLPRVIKNNNKKLNSHIK